MFAIITDRSSLSINTFTQRNYTSTNQCDLIMHITKGVTNLDFQGSPAWEIKFYLVHIFQGKMSFFLHDLGFRWAPQAQGRPNLLGPRHGNALAHDWLNVVGLYIFRCHVISRFGIQKFQTPMTIPQHHSWFVQKIIPPKKNRKL